jgi:hypothetical protein
MGVSRNMYAFFKGCVYLRLCIYINIISGIGYELFTRIVLSSERLNNGPNNCGGGSEQYDAYQGVRHGFIYEGGVDLGAR